MPDAPCGLNRVSALPQFCRAIGTGILQSVLTAKVRSIVEESDKDLCLELEPYKLKQLFPVVQDDEELARVAARNAQTLGTYAWERRTPLLFKTSGGYCSDVLYGHDTSTQLLVCLFGDMQRKTHTVTASFETFAPHAHALMTAKVAGEVLDVLCTKETLEALPAEIRVIASFIGSFCDEYLKVRARVGERCCGRQPLLVECLY